MGSSVFASFASGEQAEDAVLARPPGTRGFVARTLSRHPLAAFVGLQVAVTLAGALVSVLVEGPRLAPAAPARFAGVVAFTGLAMTAGAFFVMNWGQRHTTAVRAALIFSLEPVAAALFSHFVGGEALSALDWVGGSLIVLGVVVGELGGALTAPPARA